jgi:transcription initiation factor TFIID subunit TAF12
MATHRVQMSQSNISAEMVSSIFKCPERELNGESDKNACADQSVCLPLNSSETQPVGSVSTSPSKKQFLSSASPLLWSSSPSPDTASRATALPDESDSADGERVDRCSAHCPDIQWRLEADVKRVHTADYVDR